MKKLLVVSAITVLVIILGLVAVACGATTTTTTAAPVTTTEAVTTTVAAATTTTVNTEPIVIGHICNLTGPEAMVGADQQASLDYALSTMNATIAGRPVKIITEDAKGEAAGAVDAAKKLVEQDHVVAIIGPTEIGQKMAVAGYIKGAGIPDIIYNPSPDILFQDNPWIVGSGGSTNMPGSVMADYLFNDMGVKSIVTLTEDNQGGHSFMDPLTDLFKKDGGTVAQQYWVPEETTDYSTYLTALPKADALVVWEPGGAGISLFGQCYAMKVYSKMKVVAAYHGGCTDPFVPISLAESNAEAAKAMIGIVAPQMYAPDKADPAFVAAFQKARNGFSPQDDGSSGPYQALLLLQAAIEATKGDTTPANLIKALFAAKITGHEGDESFVEGSQVAVKTYYILKVDAVPHVPNVYHYVTVKEYKDVPAAGFTGGAASTPPSS